MVTYRAPNDLTAAMKQLSFLFVGESGTGKSTLVGQACATFSKMLGKPMLILNMEPETNMAVPAIRSLTSDQAMILDNPHWPQIMEAITSDVGTKFCGLAIDGFLGYARECLYDIITYEGSPVATRPRLNIDQKFLGNQNTWNMYNERIANHTQFLAQRPFPLIATGTIGYDKDEVTGKIYRNINMWGKSARNIPPLFSINGLCMYSANKFTIEFRPVDGFPARDKFGVLNPVEEADFNGIMSKIVKGIVEKK